MNRHIGILTAGGDSPGLNAAIRAISKTAMDTFHMEVVVIRDGLRGLMQKRVLRLERSMIASNLTQGRTIL